MSLSSRLAEAAVVRGDPADIVLGMGGMAEPAGTDPVVIDSGIEPGKPAPCPACGGAGFLDRIDLARRLQHEHCTACAQKWSRPI